MRFRDLESRATYEALRGPVNDLPLSPIRPQEQGRFPVPPGGPPIARRSPASRPSPAPARKAGTSRGLTRARLQVIRRQPLARAGTHPA
ncbi:hypothetical protein GCM10012287_05380 [Streptomyces daqingensis]|uniref:Uncharacterized protein n=1 Tax=Streptomyces daqingensis TaxID=1472640 RepID=A0ABQ2LU39_9ACTN|nr:hypothetical protein GCM10012287_05380 [Streptomyces daqingensis]